MSTVASHTPRISSAAAPRPPAAPDGPDIGRPGAAAAAVIIVTADSAAAANALRDTRPISHPSQKP
ncbi:hypothetical protein GCM10027162_46760 [Streptomyces incanus]